MMRRILIIQAVIALVILTASSVHAQTPTPADYIRYIDRGTPNENVTDSQSETMTITGTPKPIPTIVKVEKAFGVSEATELQYSKLTNLERTYEQALNPLTPYFIQQRSNRIRLGKYVISGNGIICKIEGETVGNEDSEYLGRYKTATIDQISKVVDYAHSISPLLGGQYSYAPNDGERYDMDAKYPKIEIGENAIPPCDINATGQDMGEESVAITEKSGFFSTLLRFVMKFFQGTSTQTATANFASQQVIPYYGSVDGVLTGGQGQGDISYLPSEEQEKVRKGGTLETYVPSSYKPNVTAPNGAQPNFSFDGVPVDTHDTATRTIATMFKDAKCMIAPKMLQERVVAGSLDDLGETYDENSCVIQVASGASCNGKSLPTMTANPSCSLCNTDAMYEFIRQVNPEYVNQLPEGKVPQAAIDVLNAAASAYNIPAALLFGVMIHEGSFTWDDWLWTEENAVCWSVEGGKIGQTSFGDDASCLSHAHPVTGSRGPFGWIDVWFNPYRDAVNVVETRSEYDQCNLMDAAFAAAKALYESQAGNASLTPCQGYTPYTGNGGRVASCTQWDVKRIVTAYLVFAGNTCSNNNVARTVNAFNQFSCF